LTKEQKEELRSKNQYYRDTWESKNLGGFKRCFPSESDVSTFSNSLC